jgi:hypothetical protein
VPGLRAGALDLQIAPDVAAAIFVGPVADDRDQVLRVLAFALVVVVRDADRARRAEARVSVLLVVAGAAWVRLGNPAARLLAIDARQDQDAVVRLRSVHGRLDVAVTAAIEERQIAPLRLAAEQPPDAPAGVGLADDERLARRPVLRNLAELVVRVVGQPFGVAVGDPGADGEQEGDGSQERERARWVHVARQCSGKYVHVYRFRPGAE